MPAVADSRTEQAEKAQRTIAQIKSALDSGESASIAQIVELIRDVTCKFESISVQQLGEAVGRDLLTMSRVISIAHSLGYNPEGVEITTINQAIHVIGFDKIRNLALSLMLMQNATASGAAEKRNVAASALAGGLVAQVIREKTNPRDAEEAFVCAALRNFGRIMLANLLPDQYQEAVRRSAGESEANVFRECFGLTPLELSAELLGQTGLPKSMVVGLREVTPSMRSSKSLSTEQEIPVLATFTAELCELMDQPSSTVESFSDKALRLVQSFGPNIALSEDELFDVLDQVSSTLNTFGALQSDSALNCPMLNRLKALALKTDAIDGRVVTPVAVAPISGDGAEEDSRKHHYKGGLTEAIGSLIELEEQGPVSIDKLYEIVLPAIHRELDFAQTIVFRRTKNSGRFSAWRGKGDFFAMIRGEELLNAKVRDLFSVCLRRGEDVIIQNPADPKIKSFVPDWLRSVAGSQPMALLPVQDKDGTVTVFCGLRNSSDPFELTVQHSQQLRSLRQRISTIEKQSA